MSTWSLKKLLESLHAEIERQLQTVRETMGHPGSKGDASEQVWLELFKTYLPARYKADTAHVVDSRGSFSEQIDVVVYDRQYSPFIFHYKGQKVIPAESVYAVFEAKQNINADHINYAQQKIQSVRNLHRTSLPIPHAGGTFPAKPHIPIIGGVLTLESDWSPAMGKPMHKALCNGDKASRLDMGCVAAHGHFTYDQKNNKFNFHEDDKPATVFLFWLISQLQFSGTVPMIDIQAYAQWLSK